MSEKKSSGLTAEQLDRIERNKRKAQELLKAKRKQLHGSGEVASVLGVPVRKKPALPECHVSGIQNLANFNFMPNMKFGSKQSHVQTSLSSNDTSSPTLGSSTKPQSIIPPVTAITSKSGVHFLSPNTLTCSASSKTLTFAHLTTSNCSVSQDSRDSAYSGKSSYSSSNSCPSNSISHHGSNPLPSCSHPSLTTSHPPPPTSSHPPPPSSHPHPPTSYPPLPSSHSPPSSFYPPPPSSNPPPSSSSIIPLKQRIKANFVMLSKEKFKVLVPYDSSVLEVFKKMKTKHYDAKNASWGFSIQDYDHLVNELRKECKHVELNLAPQPVISLFQRLYRGQPVTSSSKGKGVFHGDEMDWSRINSKLSSTLMQFQREGVEYSVRRGGRVMIADDMGLGKTLQAIAVMSYYRADWPLLVVCPSSLRIAWGEAFKRWIPGLRDRDINVVLVGKSSTLDSLINIISYDSAVKMARSLIEKRFKAVIIDESHFLKNYKTARYKAVAPIVKASQRSILLSGTPALSRPIELFTQINMLERNFRSVSLTQFGKRYCNGVKSHFGWNFSGASNMLELQLYMEEALMIRRMKTDVLDQLPEKRRKMVLLDLSQSKVKGKDWKRLQQDLSDTGKLKANERRTALLPLYEKTGRMKIPAINNYILDLLEGGRKLIVFGHHVSVLDSVTDVLSAKGHGFIRIDGRTAADVRQSYCDTFQHDDKCLVAVLSITTANAGLTLTAASTVVFAELFWNPGILIQAEDRAYRIGQHNSVDVHYLVAQDTADDFIWPLIQLKLGVLCQAGLAKEDFSKADNTTVMDISQKSLLNCFETQKTLLDFFSEMIPEPEQADAAGSTVSAKPSCRTPSATMNEDESKGQMIELAGTSCNDASSDLSNWFDNLDEEDFNSLDS